MIFIVYIIGLITLRCPELIKLPVGLFKTYANYISRYVRVTSIDNAAIVFLKAGGSNIESSFSRGIYDRRGRV